MASTNDEKRQLEEHLLQQAAAARGGENTAESRHMGHDVPLEAAGLDATDVQYDVPPPAYGEEFGTIQQEKDGFGTKASVTNDGRVNIRIDQRNRRLSQLLVPTLNQLHTSVQEEHAPPPPYIPPSLGGEEGVAPPPPMNVVIQIVGSRGDVQPFVALAKVLKERYGHRVRLATHPNFKDFVTQNGVEFFNIGGDPQGLMAFMVKNPGLMPGFDSLRAGDVGMRRKEVAEYLQGCWRSCFETGDGFGPAASDNAIDDWSSQPPGSEDLSQKPFVADCIIANPPSFAHAHIAEKMGIPLHIFFTMPYSPTQAFPHPLANIQNSNADENLTNYISYALVDMLTWQGLGDVINRFRTRSLGLDEMSLMWAPGMLQRLKVPYTYAWSPSLIPKPRDWGANISIPGFFFLDQAQNYTPEPDLKAFLDAGPPPVYIGFGSIVLDDPNGMTELIFEAVRKSGQRALVSKGWGGVGADQLGKPDGVFMLGNVPHDWLFKHVSCVVHHGGAGTTSVGITAGRPTLVVPFFGDQPFWGAMVARAGAGPEPINNKKLTSDNLAEGIRQCLEPQMQERAQEMARKMAKENGSEVGAQSLHQFLDVDKMRCSVAPSRAAVWSIKRTQARLSAMAACTLAQEGLLDFNDLKLFRAREYEADEGPTDPISGGATAIIGTFSAMMLGVADLPSETLKMLKIHPEARAARAASKAEAKKREEEAGGSGESTPPGTESRASEKTESRHSSSPSRASTRSMTDPKTSDAASEHSSRTNSTFNFQDSLAALNAGPLSPGSEGSGQKRGNSMANALGGQLGRPKSHTGSRPESPTRRSGSDATSMLKTAAGTGKGVNRIVGAGLKSPMEFSMNLTKGFQNAPKLYGDDTVRKSEKVTGFRSGLTAAGKGFGLGLYDGITGFVTQPIKGAAKEGGVGFLKGVGKGVGGLMLKPGAAFFGIPGYTMKGVYKEMQKHFGSSVQNYIIAARTAQGFEEYQQASIEERRDVVMRWKALQKDLKKKRNPDELVRCILDEQMQKKEAWLQHRRETRDEKRSNSFRGEDPEAAMLAMGNYRSRDEKSYNAATTDHTAAEERAVEEAIRQSVAQTSYGDPVDDARVAQGMRNRVAQFQETRTPSVDELEDEQLRRAMEESAAEAERHHRQQSTHDEELERVMAESLNSQRGQPSSHGYNNNGSSSSQQPPSYDPGHLGGMTRAEYDRQQAQQPGEKTQQERTEEQVVLEYIKKQSLLEEENRKKAAASRAPADDNDAEMQRALRMSMQGRGQHGEASGS